MHTETSKGFEDVSSSKQTYQLEALFLEPLAGNPFSITEVSQRHSSILSSPMPLTPVVKIISRMEDD